MKIIYKLILSVLLVIAAPAPVHAHFLSFLNPVNLFSWIWKSTVRQFSSPSTEQNHPAHKSWLSIWLNTWIWKKKSDDQTTTADVGQGTQHTPAPLVISLQQDDNTTNEVYTELSNTNLINQKNILLQNALKKHLEKPQATQKESPQITEKSQVLDTSDTHVTTYITFTERSNTADLSHPFSNPAPANSSDQITAQLKIESDSQQSNNDDASLPEASCTQSTIPLVIIQGEASDQTSTASADSEQAKLKKLQDIREEIRNIRTNLNSIQRQQIVPGTFCCDALKKIQEAEHSIQQSTVNQQQNPGNSEREKTSISHSLKNLKEHIQNVQTTLPALSDTPLEKQEQATIEKDLIESKSLFEPKKRTGHTIRPRKIQNQKKVIIKKSTSNATQTEDTAEPSIDLYEEKKELIRKDQQSRQKTKQQPSRMDNPALRKKLDLLNTTTAGTKAVLCGNSKTTNKQITSSGTHILAHPVIKTIPAIALLKGLLFHTFYIHYPQSNVTSRLVPQENCFFRLLITFLNKNMAITDIDASITIGKHTAPLLHQVIEDPESFIAHLGITMDPTYLSDMPCFGRWLIHALLVIGADIYKIHKHKNLLMLAAVKNHPLATLSLLLQGGININHLDRTTRSASALLKLLRKKNGKTAQEQTADTQTVMDLLQLGARLHEDEKARLNEKNFIHNTAALEKYKEAHKKTPTGWFTSSPSPAEQLYNQANHEKDLKQLELEFSDFVPTDDAEKPLIDETEQQDSSAVIKQDMTKSMELAVAAQANDLRTMGKILEGDPGAALRPKQGGWTALHASILNSNDRVEKGSTETLDFVRRKLIEKNVSRESIESKFNTQVTLKNGGKATGGQLLLRKQLCASYAK